MWLLVIAEDVEIDVESMVWTLESDGLGSSHAEVDHSYSSSDHNWLWLDQTILGLETLWNGIKRMRDITTALTVWRALPLHPQKSLTFLTFQTNCRKPFRSTTGISCVVYSSQIGSVVLWCAIHSTRHLFVFLTSYDHTVHACCLLSSLWASL